MTQEPESPQHRPRLLALDPGEKRVGVAISDDLGLFAHPRPAIQARSVPEVVSAVSKLVADESVAEVIVGLPLTLSGERAHQAARVRPLIAALRAGLPVPVREIDERMSSAQAVAQHPELAGRRDGTLDSAAAAVVLQGVLDSKRGGFAR